MSARNSVSGGGLQRSANLPSNTNFTMCGWGKVANYRSNWQWFAGLEDAPLGSSWTLIGWNVGNNMNLSWVTNGITMGLGASEPATGTWFFWAMTRDGDAAGDQIGYVALANDVAFTTQASHLDMGAFTPGIMSFFNDGYNEWCDMSLAHIRVWDAVLNSTELWAERQSATLVRTANINCVFRLATGSDINDISGNGRNPSLMGDPLTTDDDPPVGSGLPSATVPPMYMSFGAPNSFSNFRMA